MAFKKQLLFRFLIAHQVHSSLVFLLSFLSTLSPTLFFYPPCRALINTLSTLCHVSDEDSLHFSPTPVIFSCFCVFIYHVAYLPSFLPFSVSCYLFVFPFSLCHHKLPLCSVSPSQHSTPSTHMSPSSASVSCPRTLFLFTSPPHLSLHPSVQSFMSIRVSKVLQGVFGVTVKLVLSPQAAFITKGL